MQIQLQGLARMMDQAKKATPEQLQSDVQIRKKAWGKLNLSCQYRAVIVSTGKSWEPLPQFGNGFYHCASHTGLIPLPLYRRRISGFTRRVHPWQPDKLAHEPEWFHLRHSGSHAIHWVCAHRHPGKKPAYHQPGHAGA